MKDPLIRFGAISRNWAEQSRPWTNVYGLARTLLATGTAATLTFSQSSTIFHGAWGVPHVPICYGPSRIGLFCLASRHLELARWIAVVILLIVASGWYPRVTGLLHWWVSFSLATSAVLVDGGDQVSQVLTLLLLPICLTDPRKWHWQKQSNYERRYWKSLIALSALLALRVQVAGIYFHAAVGKLRVPEWTDGTALYYWFTHPDFGAPRPVFYVLAPLLRHGPLIALMTWGAILIEISLFMALVMPKRAWSYFLIIGLGFHSMIAIIHGLVSFGFAMVAALVLYLRPTEKVFATPFLQSFWQSFQSRKPEAAKVESCQSA